MRQAGRGALEHDEAASEGGPYFFLSSVLCRTGCCCIGCTRWGGEASGVSGARLRVARSTLAQISAVLAESCAVSSAKKRRSSGSCTRSTASAWCAFRKAASSYQSRITRLRNQRLPTQLRIWARLYYRRNCHLRSQYPTNGKITPRRKTIPAAGATRRFGGPAFAQWGSV